MLSFVQRCSLLKSKIQPQCLSYSFASKKKVAEVEVEEETTEDDGQSGVGEYGIQSKMSGKSEQNLYERYRGFHNSAFAKVNLPGTTIIKSRDQAHQAVKVLKKFQTRIHAWDTETIDLDVKTESPIGSGKIICASAFCGIDVNFGSGPRLFVDNFAQNTDLIMIFKEYFEDSRYKKAWHNYGFDRHIFYNHGIDVQGFGGDTMQMARLDDCSRGPKEYSLENTTKALEEEIVKDKLMLIKQVVSALDSDLNRYHSQMKLLREGLPVDQEFQEIFLRFRIDSNVQEQIEWIEHKVEGLKQRRETTQIYEQHLLNQNIKTSMKSIFGKKKLLKDGKEGKTLEYPSIIRMHTDPNLVENWINYSCLDAEATYFVHRVLSNKLKSRKIPFENMENMFGLYEKYWLPFGEILTDIERRGFEINIEHLDKVKIQAENEMVVLEKNFMDWVCKIQPGLEQFNAASAQQLQQLFFAPFSKSNKEKPKIPSITDSLPREASFAQRRDIEQMSSLDERSKIKESSDTTVDGRAKGVRTEVTSLPQTKIFKVLNTKELILPGQKKAAKQLDMAITGLGLKPIQETELGMPAVDLPVLKLLSGNPKKGDFGIIGKHFKEKGQEETGKEASIAIQSLIQLKHVETLLQTFILPLRELTNPETGRIHCSLNINTETGRISARKPNLMNQPSHDKDVYKIRSAFRAGKGKKLIVADYGQLELRILAHMTNCKAMLDAFHQGGDFHSRTAIGMYPKLKEEIENGELLLEWDKSKGEAPAPLLKDKYSSERKKAKMMNFSIAYGKSAHGFSQDWGCSLDEAKEALNAWFADRREVKEWQDHTQYIAKTEKITSTLMGRVRDISRLINSPKLKGHGLRASINTPIQGGAADLVIAAMVRVAKDPTLLRLGYHLLLQIHDELILEGPEENAKEAMDRLVEIMENPLDEPLLLKMEVDAKIGDHWYECK